MLDRFLKYIESHARTIVLLIVLLTLFFAYKALGLTINADYEIFMPWGDGEDTYIVGEELEIAKNTVSLSDVEASRALTESLINDREASDGKESTAVGSGLVGGSVEYVKGGKHESDYEHPSNYIVMLEAENLYSADNLNAIEMCIDRIASFPELSEPSSVLDFVTFEKKGTRLATVPIKPALESEGWSEEAAKTLERRIKNDPIIKYYLVGEDGNSLMFQFSSSSFDAETERESFLRPWTQ